MKKLVIVIAAIGAFYPITAISKTLWQSPEWTVYQRDADNKDNQYSCELVGVFFNIVVSAKDGTPTFQLPIIDGQGNVPKVEFRVSISFDKAKPLFVKAKHVAEYETTMAPIADFESFVELVARSKSVEITGGGVDRTVPLKGSRVVIDAFQSCLDSNNVAKR